MQWISRQMYISSQFANSIFTLKWKYLLLLKWSLLLYLLLLVIGQTFSWVRVRSSCLSRRGGWTAVMAILGIGCRIVTKLHKFSCPWLKTISCTVEFSFWRCLYGAVELFERSLRIWRISARMRLLWHTKLDVPLPLTIIFTFWSFSQESTFTCDLLRFAMTTSGINRPVVPRKIDRCRKFEASSFLD